MGPGRVVFIHAAPVGEDVRRADAVWDPAGPLVVRDQLRVGGMRSGAVVAKNEHGSTTTTLPPIFVVPRCGRARPCDPSRGSATGSSAAPHPACPCRAQCGADLRDSWRKTGERQLLPNSLELSGASRAKGQS